MIRFAHPLLFRKNTAGTGINTAPVLQALQEPTCPRRSPSSAESQVPQCPGCCVRLLHETLRIQGFKDEPQWPVPFCIYDLSSVLPSIVFYVVNIRHLRLNRQVPSWVRLWSQHWEESTPVHRVVEAEVQLELTDNCVNTKWKLQALRAGDAV